jgi:acyl-CoA dehydrogenase
LVEMFDKVSNDNIPTSEDDAALTRLLIAILKKESAEQAIHFSHEAIELHGGNGYIEDFVLPRLLRDAQVLTVWEGTANILGLEVLRLMRKHRVHELFLNKMKKELAGLPEEMSKLGEPVREGLIVLEKLLVKVARADVDTQTYHSKRIAELMVRVYESVIALSDAALFGGERRRMIADIFIENAWKKNEWLDPEMKSLKYFEEIVGLNVNVY